MSTHLNLEVLRWKSYAIALNSHDDNFTKYG